MVGRGVVIEEKCVEDVREMKCGGCEGDWGFEVGVMVEVV